MNEPGLEKDDFSQVSDARQKCVQNSDSLLLESSKRGYDSYMKEKILPIELPIVQTFLSHAYSLAILQNTISYKGWFFTNYMQLYTYYNRKNPLGDYKIDFFSCKGKYPDVPFFEYYKINKEIFVEMKNDIVEFSIQMLDKEYYIESGIDEFYWPNKKSYNQKHYHHDNLIFGYNLTNRVFYYLGYDKNMVFGKYSVDFASYTDSFIYNKDSNLRMIKSYNRELFDADSRYIYHDNLDFDIRKFAQYLSDYINSKNSFISHTGSDFSIFGINVYYDIMEKIILDRNIGKDMRLYRLLWEHKVIMLHRLKYLSDVQIISNKDTLCEEFSKLEREFFIVKNMAIKFLVNNNLDLLQSILKKIDTLARADKELCEKLLLSLS
ncbi:hypothetical protein J7E78_05360 [Paenibacillus polymyxa]|uniref:hypothetical protein n=1 Tax=Paenibacillus polymyxa TaxID=1406 RepID=UPI001BE9A9BE|nr:hypothetical protein [Paenibacillus polymyxa]MBT2282966.1 hypothetical protein [Paenibacillus polymyxa]